MLSRRQVVLAAALAPAIHALSGLAPLPGITHQANGLRAGPFQGMYNLAGREAR